MILTRLDRTQKKFALLFALVVAVLLFLRVYDFAALPAGLTWDEAAIGYNGYAVRTTRRDEWLHFLPVSFMSFGDFKAPLAIYVNGVSTLIFGLNSFGVRFPFVLAGMGSVLGILLLVDMLFRNDRFFRTVYTRYRFQILACGSIIVLTNPWLFHFSRAGFESGMALFFTVWAVFLLLFSLLDAPVRYRWLTFLLSCIAGVCALYTYHSAKILLPVVGLSVLLMHAGSVKQLLRKRVIATIIVSILLVLPLVRDSLFGPGAERLKQTSIYYADVSSVEKVRVVLQNFWAHLSPSFLISGQTTTLRHGDGLHGVLLVSEFILLLIALSFLLFSRKISTKNSTVLLACCWLLAGILPAAIGTEAPHANRALLAYPGFLILEIVALVRLCTHFSSTKTQLFWKSAGVSGVLILVLVVHGLFATQYLWSYFTQFKSRSEADFFYGYKEVFDWIRKNESTAEKILFTSEYGQPYIYALFYNKINPIVYQGGALIKYEFTTDINTDSALRSKTLIVATPEQVDPSIADQLVIGPSGAVRFVLVNTNP